MHRSPFTSHDPVTCSYLSTPDLWWHCKVAYRKASCKATKYSQLYVIWEIPLWLTLHAFAWCSLRRTSPCVSSCSGSGCCWAGWQATTRPSTSVWRPGGPLSWLGWGWKDERNPNVPPTASVSRPGNATAVPVLYWHVHVPAALILPHHAHTQLLLRDPALSSPATWWTSVEISNA